MGALLQNYKNIALLPKGEQSLDSSSSACPYHCVPRRAQLLGWCWVLLSLGGQSVVLVEKHLYTTALSLVSSMKGSPQGTVRSKACSPLALSEAEAGNFVNGNCQGILVLPQAGTGKGTRAFSLLHGVNGVTSPHLKRQTFLLKQRAQEAAASGCCCFSHLCLSAPCRYPFFSGNAAAPLCLQGAFGYPSNGTEEHICGMSLEHVTWALCLELGTVGHGATATTDAQLLHPGGRTLLFNDDKQVHCEYFLCKG